MTQTEIANIIDTLPKNSDGSVNYEDLEFAINAKKEVESELSKL